MAPGWALAAAGLAAGLAAGTKVTVLAPVCGADGRRDRPLAPRGRRSAAAAWWFVPVARRQRLLVPAQPDRRRQPDSPGPPPRPDLAARARSAFRWAVPTSTSSTTRPTPASGASTSRPGCTRPSDCSGRWCCSAALAGALLALLRGPGRAVRWTGGRRAVRDRRLPGHPAERRRRRGRPGRLRDQHPLRDPGAAARGGPAAARSRASIGGAASGCCSARCSP